MDRQVFGGAKGLYRAERERATSPCAPSHQNSRLNCRVLRSRRASSSS